MIGYAGLRTAKNANGAYAKLLAAGLTSLILCQALLNVYAVLGLAPLTGVPLPFISSGSTLADRAAVRDGPAAQRRRRRLGAPARRARAAPGDRERPRIVIAAGGTAGHVVPAIAVADALRAEGAEVAFVGGERAEAELVPAAGYALDPIRVEGHLALEPAEGRAGGRGRPSARCARRKRILGAPARRGAGRRGLRRRPRRARRPRGGASRSCWPRLTRTSA